MYLISWYFAYWYIIVRLAAIVAIATSTTIVTHSRYCQSFSTHVRD